MHFHILSYFFSVICCILVYSPFGGKPQKSFLRSWDPTPSQSHPMNSSRCHWVIRILGLTFCHEISSFGDQSSTLQGTEAAATTSGHQLCALPMFHLGTERSSYLQSEVSCTSSMHLWHLDSYKCYGATLTDDGPGRLYNVSSPFWKTLCWWESSHNE